MAVTPTYNHGNMFTRIFEKCPPQPCTLLFSFSCSCFELEAILSHPFPSAMPLNYSSFHSQGRFLILVSHFSDFFINSSQKWGFRKLKISQKALLRIPVWAGPVLDWHVGTVWLRGN